MRLRRGALALLFVIGFSFATATTATAGTILSPTTAVASFTKTGDILHVIDHSGLLSPFTSGVTDFDTYIASNPRHTDPGAPIAWSGDALIFRNDTITIDFGLGAPYLLQSLAMWTDGPGFSIKDFKVFTSMDSTFASATQVGSFTAIGSPDSDPPAQVFALAPSTGRFVRLEILSGTGIDFAVIAEAALEVEPVRTAPEPASMLLLGAGFAAAAVRRSSKRA